MTHTQLKTLSTQLDLNRSVTIGKYCYVNNAQRTVESLFRVYEGAKTDKQRDRYEIYLNLIEIILNKCR